MNRRHLLKQCAMALGLTTIPVSAPAVTVGQRSTAKVSALDAQNHVVASYDVEVESRDGHWYALTPFPQTRVSDVTTVVGYRVEFCGISVDRPLSHSALPLRAGDSFQLQFPGAMFWFE